MRAEPVAAPTATTGLRLKELAQTLRFVPPALVAAVALALRLRLAWENIDNIVLKSTPDDAYYYFNIARNIAHGHNVTFDGETITNGFHPLWLALITPVFVFVHGEAMPVHVVLSMGALLGAASVVLIYAIVARLTGRMAPALLGAGFYSVHPAAISDSVNGVESSLVVCMFLLCVWLFIDLDATGARPLRRDAMFGAACGLMILARTDMIFVAPLMIAYLALRSPRDERVGRTVTMTAACAAVLAPWIIWMILATHTLVQISGVAGAWLARDAFLATHGDGWSVQIRHGLSSVHDALFRDLARQYFVPQGRAVAPFAMAAAVLSILMFFVPIGEPASAARRRMTLLAIPSLGVLAALLYHAGVRWHVRVWYFAPSAAAGAIFIGLAANYLCDMARAIVARWRAISSERVTAPLCAALAIAFVVIYHPQDPQRWIFYPEIQSNVLATARWIDANTAPGARIGSPNAGIIGYYSRRTVVDLDGVVNADAYHALRQCRSAQYIRDQKLDYLADLPPALLLVNCGSPSLRLTTIATIGRKLNYYDGGQLAVERIDPN